MDPCDSVLLFCSGILTDVKRDNRVLSLVNRAGLKGTLTQMLDQLQRCQKSLNEFLEVLDKSDCSYLLANCVA